MSAQNIADMYKTNRRNVQNNFTLSLKQWIVVLILRWNAMERELHRSVQAGRK